MDRLMSTTIVSRSSDFAHEAFESLLRPFTVTSFPPTVLTFDSPLDHLRMEGAALLSGRASDHTGWGIEPFAAPKGGVAKGEMFCRMNGTGGGGASYGDM